MRPRDQPTGRAGPMDEHAEEPIIIVMSMNGQEEAEANAQGLSPCGGRRRSRLGLGPC